MPARPRIVDSRDMARAMRETFADKPVKKQHELPFQWPTKLQNIGESLAVAYASDKWKQDGDFELYKHVAESRNVVYCVPRFLHPYESPTTPLKTIGPMVDFSSFPMPGHFAVLAYFEEIDLRLYTSEDQVRDGFKRNARGNVHDHDDGVIKVTVKHGMLGAGKIRWSTVGNGKDQPFLFVYTTKRAGDRGGVHMIVVGEELDIEKDGIVG